MNKFTAVGAALALGVSGAYASETIQFKVDTIGNEKWAVAHDKNTSVTFSFGYGEEERDCKKLFFGVSSWYPISDSEEREITMEAAIKIDDLDPRLQILEGQLMHVVTDEVEADLYQYGVFAHDAFLTEMINGGSMVYIDETYEEDVVTFVDLSDLEYALASVVEDCIDRGGEIKADRPELPKTRL